MKNKWLYLVGCFFAPHIMIVLGIILLSKKDFKYKYFGLKLCQWSTITLIIGSLAYFIFFVPEVSID